MLDNKQEVKLYIVSMEPPTGHVDELQRVVPAHDLTVAQNVQLGVDKHTHTERHTYRVDRTVTLVTTRQDTVTTNVTINDEN